MVNVDAGGLGADGGNDMGLNTNDDGSVLTRDLGVAIVVACLVMLRGGDEDKAEERIPV
jgi:hypothetical protein